MSVQSVRTHGLNSETGRQLVAQGLRSVPTSDVEALAVLTAEHDLRRGLQCAMRLLLTLRQVTDQGTIGVGDLHTVLKECHVTFSPLLTVYLYFPKTNAARKVAVELISRELQPYLLTANLAPEQLVALGRFTDIGPAVERMVQDNLIAPASLPWNTVFPLVVHFKATPHLWRYVDPSRYKLGT